MENIQKFVRDDEDEQMDFEIKEGDHTTDTKEKLAGTFPSGIDEKTDLVTNFSQFQYYARSPYNPNTPQSGGKGRSRPIEEKERTRLRERNRRAITARILAGLRRHGNYNLRVRADINDVIAALAKEAGWVVLPDGTTFPSTSQGSKSLGCTPLSGSSQCYQALHNASTSFKGGSFVSHALKGVASPALSPHDISGSSSQTSAVGDQSEQIESDQLVGYSIDAVDGIQVVDAAPLDSSENFIGVSYVPVYAMLPLGVISKRNEVLNPGDLLKQLEALKSANIDGVKVDCWWGIVEANTPKMYNWSGYKKLFGMVQDLQLKLQVVMSFHECGGTVGDDVCIQLPTWIDEIGRCNPDIFFCDREGRANTECLSWGIDKERILAGRTAIEVYFDYMRSFRTEFDELFEAGVITMVEVGLGSCGELRYPSCPLKHGWRYPGIGEFQCYDKYLLKILRESAESRGQPHWARGPDNAGFYNSLPHETGFFCDRGDYDGYFGRFFLRWYSQVLVDHGDLLLSLAKLVFCSTAISIKVPCIYWGCRTNSHAPELTAGFYNSCNRDGYAAVMAMLKKHDAVLNFPLPELCNLNEQVDNSKAQADPSGLTWQVLNDAWDVGVVVVGENSVPCHCKDAYDTILHTAKPVNHPEGKHFLSFTYQRLSPQMMDDQNFMQLVAFVKKMHGQSR